MGFRCNWRSGGEFRSEGLTISSSTSDEAIKLYDQALTQLVGWYDDPNQDGGLGGTLEKMDSADPGFVLGKALSLGIELIGTGNTVRLDTNLNQQLNDLKRCVEERKSVVEWRERAHVEALDRFANADMFGATRIWEEILDKHPTDMHALKFAHDTYFYLGERPEMRRSIERVLPAWNGFSSGSLPLSEYLHGMHAFSLEENQQYSAAETEARAGLAKQQYDAWATHALAHVFEMRTQTLEGLSFLSSTVDDWNRCNFLACHNFWHWALFHIEHDEPDGAMDLLEREILSRAKSSGAMLDVVDAASLLYRLELVHPKEGFTQPQMWSSTADSVQGHFGDNILGFNQLHFAMLCLGADREKDAETLLESMRDIKDQIHDRWPQVTEQLLLAMIDFKREKYSQSVERMLQVRENVYMIGGSDAQRDLFNHLLIVGAIRSRDKELCTRLLKERQDFKGTDLPVRKLQKFLKDCLV